MKRLLTLLALSLASVAAFGTTFVPVQLLNPASSTSGQAIVSTGPSSAPAWGNVTATMLAAQAANTVVANVTGSSASPTAFAMPSCSASGNALNYTSGTGWTCATGYALLASPTFTGVPAAPTAAAGTNTTQLATTAFVQGINAGRLLNVQVFTGTGTYTPTTGTNKEIIEIQASGGGSGGVAATSTSQNAASQSGSGGSYAMVYWTTPASVTVTIGATGTAGASGANAGGSASATTVGSVVSCPGGIGGAGAAGQATGFNQSGAAAPAACTVTGAVTLKSVAGGVGPTTANLSSAAGYYVPGGTTPMGLNAAGGSGMGGNGIAIPASTAASAGNAGISGKVIFYEYN